MEMNAEREKLLQEYTVIYGKHAKEEEILRKSIHPFTQNASIFETNARKLSRPTTNSNLCSLSAR
jgi:hypothetical protein